MLTPTRTNGLRKLASGLALTIRADWSGLVDDIVEAVWPAGSALPVSSSWKWPGRLFWHTGEKTLYVCDGTSWLPLGGEQLIDLGTFGAPTTGYSYDTAGGASYVRKSGKRIDVRLRIKKDSGSISHGQAVFQASAGFMPAGVGAWPLTGIQAGGSASASAVGAVMNASGTISPLSPSTTAAHTTLEVNGTYYIP